MINIKILISGLGGSIFPYLHNKLTEDGFEMFYVDSNNELSYIYSEFNFYHSPSVSDPSYKSFIKEICQRLKIDVYIPLIDEEILTALEIGEEIQHIKVLAPNKEFTELCLNKISLMNVLKNSGISKIDTFQGDFFSWQMEPPVFIKPNFGRGSRGIRKIENKDQLDAYYKFEHYTPQETIIQPFINGTEYTVGVLVNKVDQILSISTKRVISKKGITISSVTENNKIIEDIAVEINKFLKPKGPFNIQLFLDTESIPYIFEINPRFSTTLVQSYESGLHEISLFLDNYQKSNVTLQKGEENLFLYRKWESFFYRK